jgi:hypothetical protein
MSHAARAAPGIEIYSYHRGKGNSFSFSCVDGQQKKRCRRMVKPMRCG